jgi:hypothetical protein
MACSAQRGDREPHVPTPPGGPAGSP